MNYATGKIDKFEVRCACGESCENAQAYGRHKVLCGTHRKAENAVSTAPNSTRKSDTISETSSIPVSSPRSVACWCGRTFKNNHAFRTHGRYCAVYKQQTNVHSSASDPARGMKLNSGIGSVSAAGERPTSLADSTTKKAHCACGQTFANEKALNKHLRYSKTHQGRKSASASASASTSEVNSPGSMPFAASHSSPTSPPPASCPIPHTIPLSGLSTASLLVCTCGHILEIQRVPDLHKRDSLFHNRQADKSPTRNEQWDESIISSFTSLNLGSVSASTTPTVGKFPCVCGREFTNRDTLEQHRRDAARHVWRERGKRKRRRSKRLGRNIKKARTCEL